MGRSLEVVNGRIVSRRVGSVDWQDAMDSFGRYSALIEDTGASQLLMNMSEAEVMIPGGDARDLASMFLRSTPQELAIAIIKPVNESGSRFIEAFFDMISAQGRRIATVASEAEAELFFTASNTKGAPEKPGFLSGLIARLTGRA